MDWLLSLLQDVTKTIASKAVLQVLAVLAPTLLIGWLLAWWGRRSVRVKLLLGIGGLALLAALMVGVYLETRPDRATTPFAILVADLDGDADRSQTRHILQSLRTQFGEAISRGDIEILSRGEALVVPSGNMKNGETATTAKGRAWLKEQNASVLVWGEVGGRDKLLRLRLLPAEGDGASKNYALAEQTLELPNDFGGDLGALFAARTATAISPVYYRSGEALADLIAPFVARLQPLAEKPPASFSDETSAQLWHAYAAGEARLGEERGENPRLEASIAYYKKTLAIWTRDKVPLEWASTQNDLGSTLSILGERESGTVRLEEAVAAHRAALLERTRERVPLDWAMTQNNLGTALGALGERESGTLRLEEAIAAFRSALLEHTRERFPLKWAMTQDNLGHALSILGERESETTRLEEAVAAYRDALTQFTREKVPLNWATTQNNLGSALTKLGEREGGTARLEAAVAAYRAALLEWTRDKVPLDWAATQNNLGAALKVLGQRESGTARLEEAVSACRQALEVRMRERVPMQWAATQNNLGAALKVLGQREAEADKAKGCSTLRTARDHLAAALEEYRRAGASYYVGVAQRNVALLDGVIARLCGG